MGGIPEFTERVSKSGHHNKESGISLLNEALSKISIGDTANPDRASEYEKPFIDQIDTLKILVSYSEYIDINKIESDIKEIMDRYDRIESFYKSVMYFPEHTKSWGDKENVPDRVKSIDNDQALVSGLANFLKHEIAIAEQSRRRFELISLDNGIGVKTTGKIWTYLHSFISCKMHTMQKKRPLWLVILKW